MRLVADESVDRQIVDRLRDDGHQVWYVAEESPALSDHEVLRIAQERTSILVTAAKDFGELVFRLRQAMSGVVLIRLTGLPPAAKAICVSTAFGHHADEMRNAFAVIGRRTIRIRKNLPLASGGE